MIDKDIIKYGICWYCNEGIHYSTNGSAWYHDDSDNQICDNPLILERQFATPTHEKLSRNYLEDLKAL